METTQTKNELTQAIEESGLEKQTENSIRERFTPFFEQAKDWKERAEKLIVTDVSQKEEMKLAREARLSLKDIRVNADKARKALKEDSLKYGRAVQGVYNIIENTITPIEKHLEKQEKFAEIQEAKQKAELKSKREEELQPFAEFVPFGIDLGGMSEDDYGKLVNGAKLQLEAKIAEEKKEEEERIVKEKADEEERERVKVENERLRAEVEKNEAQLEEARAKAAEKETLRIAEEKKAEEIRIAENAKIEAEAEKQREINEAKLKVEREAKEKLEAELQAKTEAEESARKEAEEKAAAELESKKEAERQAQIAPDKTKLIELSNMIENIVLPELKSEEANQILKDVNTLLNKVSSFIVAKSSNI